MVLVAASALGYVPLALAFSPWDWFQYGPFSFQWCRPLHYAVYFFAGIAVGAHGIERGVLAVNGALARRWPMWLGIALATFCSWIIPMALIMDIGQPGPLALQFLTDLGFTLACAGGGMFVLAVVLRFATSRTRVLDSLSDNAYGMYLIHYPFVVWLQYGMLNAALPAVVKGAIVFSGTLALSWGATAAMHALPIGARLIGTERRALAKSR
jgi:surface polysaccharide O-acyltransferase-like enzyme